MKKSWFHCATFLLIGLGYFSLCLLPLSCTLSGNESSTLQPASWEDKLNAFHTGKLSSTDFELTSATNLLNALPVRIAAYDDMKEEASSIAHSDINYTEVRRTFYRNDGTYLSFQLSDYGNDIPVLFQIRSLFEAGKNRDNNNLYSSGFQLLTDSSHHFSYYTTDLQNDATRIEGVWKYRYHLLIRTNEKADAAFCHKAWNMFERSQLPAFPLP